MIIEGNYLLLDEDPWRELSVILDAKWFLDCPLDIAMERVVKRHQSQIGREDL